MNLFEDLTIKQKRGLASLGYLSLSYKSICMKNPIKYDNQYGIGFFSDSRNYDDAYVSYNNLNEKQEEFLKRIKDEKDS